MSLMQATTTFWSLSCTWNGRPNGTRITTGMALQVLTEILSTTGPAHPLRARALGLQQDIIRLSKEPKNVEARQNS